MKTRLINRPGIAAITIILSLLINSELFAQLRVTRVSAPEMLTGKNGIVYSLPRTLVHVDLWIGKTQQFAGPLAEFADEFMGLDDVITKNSVNYSINNACIRTSVETDPGQVYLIEKEEKSQGEIWISFGKTAPVLSIEKFDNTVSPKGFADWDEDLYMVQEPGHLFRKYSESAARDVIDTIIRKVSIDTLVIEEKVLKHTLVEYTDREKAREAAARIRQIEQDKYNLMIGYQETAYSLEALDFMYNRLEEQRLEYLKLFTGVSVTEILKFDYHFYPEIRKENQEYTLAGFSKNAGMTEPGDENAVMVKILAEIPDTIPGPPADVQAATGLVYRLPVSALAVLSYQETEIVSKPVEVLQFGMLLTLPAEFKRVEFDLETGTLKTVILE